MVAVCSEGKSQVTGSSDGSMRRLLKMLLFAIVNAVSGQMISRLVHGRGSANVTDDTNGAGDGGPAIFPGDIRSGDPVCYVSRSTTRAAEAVIQNQQIWVYDTGSSFSTTGNLDLLKGIHNAPLLTSYSATGHPLSSELCGRISGLVNLSGVRFFPGAPNLISGGHLVQLGCTVTIDSQGCTVKKNDMVVGKGRILENNTTTIDVLGDVGLGTICADCPSCPLS